VELLFQGNLLFTLQIVMLFYSGQVHDSAGPRVGAVDVAVRELGMGDTQGDGGRGRSGHDE
jgi:hypothetical protein